MKSLGILGGSFDPIHLGHLRAAEVAREALSLEAVWLVPCGRPPHRTLVASPESRLIMAALAAAEQPGLVASDIEVSRQGTSYMIDTVEALQRAEPDAEISLILGSDAYRDVTTWRSAARLRETVRMAVVARAGDTVEAVPGVTVLPEAGLPISGTEIRERIARAASVRFLVPPAVADFIDKRRLYR